MAHECVGIVEECGSAASTIPPDSACTMPCMKTAWTDADMDFLMMLLTGLFWGVTHIWTALVLWAERRATRARAAERPSVPQPGETHA